MMGMTTNGCSTALLEEPFAFAADPERDCRLKTLGSLAGEEEDAPNFETLTETGRSFSVESRAFRFTLLGFRDSVSSRAKSSPLVGLAAKGPLGETFIVGGVEDLRAAELADLELEGRGMSDLISSA